MTAGKNSTANFTLNAEAGDLLAIVKKISYSSSTKFLSTTLTITPTIVNESGQTVANALVSISVYRNGTLYYSGSGNTSSKGTIAFKISNAASGTYVTVIESVQADGYTFDGVTPDNSYTLKSWFSR